MTRGVGAYEEVHPEKLQVGGQQGLSLITHTRALLNKLTRRK